jgi:hypothetical protein
MASKSHITKKKIMQAVAAMFIAAIVAGAGFVGFTKLVDAAHVLPYPYAHANDLSKPFTHFVAMGMYDGSVGYAKNYGGYDKAYSETSIMLQTPEAKRQYAADAIHQQLASYGPLGYAEFLGHKIKWIMSDATFFAYGEGDNNAVLFAHQDGLSKSIRQFMYVDGKYYQVFGNALQVVWLSLLLLIVTQAYFVLSNRTAKYDAYVSMLRLMVIGILLFLLIFEGRSRYIMLYVPIFIVLAMYSLRWFKDTGYLEESEK